jgi:hypothetical protein
MARSLASVLLATALCLLGGVCLAGTATKTTITLKSFEPSTNVLVGANPAGLMGGYQRTATTIHKPTLPGQLPPGPCKALAKQWDNEVRRRNPRARLTFNVLLGKMAKHHCPVALELSNASGPAMPTITRIRPSS